MKVYLDESGDTGWTFSHPFRHGGSSRFLCIAFLFLPKIHKKLPQKIISDLYAEYGWVNEKKCSQAAPSQKLQFCQTANALLQQHGDIKIECIVVKKENVQEHIRDDANKLYNYMCRLVVPEQVKSFAEIEFIPDKRTIKVESGNSLSDYLQTVLWFELNAKTKLVNHPKESHHEYNLQFVDWVANIVWSHFEDNESTVFNEINRCVKIRKLFF